MITRAISYEHPITGGYAETVATLEDGRIVTINTQYAIILPHGDHAADCDQINKIGGRCTCGKLDGIDIPALIADARINGKFGYAPRVAVKPGKSIEDKSRDRGICPKCGTYCDGDCGAR